MGEIDGEKEREGWERERERDRDEERKRSAAVVLWNLVPADGRRPATTTTHNNAQQRTTTNNHNNHDNNRRAATRTGGARTSPPTTCGATATSWPREREREMGRWGEGKRERRGEGERERDGERGRASVQSRGGDRDGCRPTCGGSDAGLTPLIYPPPNTRQVRQARRGQGPGRGHPGAPRQHEGVHLAQPAAGD